MKLLSRAVKAMLALVVGLFLLAGFFVWLGWKVVDHVSAYVAWVAVPAIGAWAILNYTSTDGYSMVALVAIPPTIALTYWRYTRKYERTWQATTDRSGTLFLRPPQSNVFMSVGPAKEVWEDR